MASERQHLRVAQKQAAEANELLNQPGKPWPSREDVSQALIALRVAADQVINAQFAAEAERESNAGPDGRPKGEQGQPGDPLWD